MSLTTDELERFAATLAGTPERWERLVRHAGEERVYEQIWDDPEVNAWVICWSEDQDTGYHDHDESAAAVAVVSGRVREDRLALAQACFEFLPTRAKLDLQGWEAEDIFAHS